MEKKRNYKPLKLYLVEHGIQQRDVADFLGIKESTMSQIMGGYGRPFTVDEAVKFMMKYGGTIELFTNKK
ncbi:helix-turn-helix transcriptional regulator [Bacillus phage vB_BceS_LY1]|uniref:Helix-turn-helix transcriptional regulator n=1 Tax=Bacillus phage vB_BceS_LY1 TaxID=2950459 RepID=A0AAE9LUR7_9CAUD|nr:helix-turn-helix transcriptional regulator [Bacillus phage vB_BceS_LY1]